MTSEKQNHMRSGSQTTRQFFLRPIERKDIDFVSDWYQQVEDVSIYDRQTPLPINREDVERVIEKQIADREKENCYWFIAESESGEPVGMTGLEMVNPVHGNAILPVFVANDWRRSGIGIRMVCLALDMGFRQLRLHRIATVYRADNDATATMIKRCGFIVEGIAREAWFARNKYYDLVNVGVLADDWDKSREEISRSMDPSIVVDLGPRASSEWRWPYHIE